ncbi:hypothetical protein GR160_07775 [Flavobacterium sp. Sd200]|uniref:hypothetical protein n=1 Tax=Flavobacterium sp. Sd200 TaxID=2692211 RepID=UPI00136DB9E3|nr:hypothetical protein [Flavobacterium sp. Sd200]MXN91127.1 hypothetical protein [Flavobacterium sp. Sd200]
MGLLDRLFYKNSLQQKVEKIKKDIKRVVAKYFSKDFDVLYYGAYDLDPKNLVYWICVDTDNEKQSLESNKELRSELRQVLLDNNYPIEAVERVFIGFESEETVKRESGGDWHIHFQ